MLMLPEYAIIPNSIHCIDALQLCNALQDASVDMILCDLPYGTTSCSWDTVIPFAPMWAGFKRVIKPRGAIVLTASQPFASALVMSNPQMYRYEWMWDKVRVTGHLDADTRPLKRHETVQVFGINEPRYYPIPWYSTRKSSPGGTSQIYGKNTAIPYKSEGERKPVSTLQFSLTHKERGLHPSQKPVALFDYLIRTYTQPGEIVFDPCVGSGSSAVAAIKTGRQFICGDSSPEYVEIARERLNRSDPFTDLEVADGIEQLSLMAHQQEG